MSVLSRLYNNQWRAVSFIPRPSDPHPFPPKKRVITSQRILQRNIKTTAQGAKRINDSDPLPHKTTPVNPICVLWHWKWYCIVFVTFIAVVCLKCNLACFYFEGEFTLLTGSCCCYGNKKSFTAGGTRHKVRDNKTHPFRGKIWLVNCTVIWHYSLVQLL